MPHVEIRGLRVFYQQSGQGPDVLLLHGLTSSLAMWAFSGLTHTLAADFRVTAYDLRGHAPVSPRPPVIPRPTWPATCTTCTRPWG